MTILQKLPVALVGAEELAKVEVPAGLFEAAIQEDGRLPGGTVHRLNQPLEEWLRARLAALRRECRPVSDLVGCASTAPTVITV